MMKDHTNLCDTGFGMINDTLNRRTERDGIIHCVDISPFNILEIEKPQRTIIFGTTNGRLSLGQIKLGPP